MMRNSSLLGWLGLFLVTASAPARGMLIVDAAVTPTGGFFDYALTVANRLADDVILITLIDAPLHDAQIEPSLMAPSGFAAFYDPGLGVVDLSEDLQSFGAGGTIEGFSFTSAVAPGPGAFASFQAFTDNFDLVAGNVTSRVVPEPATALLVGLGVGGLALARRRRLAVLFCLPLLVAESAVAASHSDAPLIKQDPQANITDVYAFIGTKYDDPNEPVLNVLVTVRPFSEPGDGAIYERFADDALYSIHLTDPARGQTLRRYNFRFSDVNPGALPGLKNAGTILSYGLGTEVGAIESIGDSRQNFSQTYKVRVDGRTAATGLLTPPPNVGLRTTPFYNDTGGDAMSGATQFSELDAYTQEAIQELPSGEAVFAGPREDGFYSDIPGIFDLLDGRILDNDGDASDGLGQDGGGVDGFKGFNVLSYAIQIPLGSLADLPLPKDSFNNVSQVGVYASVSRKRITLRRTHAEPRNVGPWVQVNRMGNPLFNEALVALEDKDHYNRTSPTQDSTLFAQYARNPELATLINVVFGTSFQDTGRSDIAAIFIPDVLRVNTLTGPVPLPGHADFNRLSVFGGDVTNGAASGFPNGRRVGDDVIDIALTALANPPGGGGPLTLVGDNVAANDQLYNQVFPYLGTPHAGPRVDQRQAP